MSDTLALWMLWNIIVLLIYGIDKAKSKNNRTRYSERLLLGLALFGGALGAFAAMRSFHHKTMKNLFRWTVPVLALLQGAAFLYFFQHDRAHQKGLKARIGCKSKRELAFFI